MDIIIESKGRHSLRQHTREGHYRWVCPCTPTYRQFQGWHATKAAMLRSWRQHVARTDAQRARVTPEGD